MRKKFNKTLCIIFRHVGSVGATRGCISENSPKKMVVLSVNILTTAKRCRRTLDTLLYDVNVTRKIGERSTVIPRGSFYSNLLCCNYMIQSLYLHVLIEVMCSFL